MKKFDFKQSIPYAVAIINIFSYFVNLCQPDIRWETA